jgi:hypothetical protein
MTATAKIDMVTPFRRFIVGSCHQEMYMRTHVDFIVVYRRGVQQGRSYRLARPNGTIASVAACAMTSRCRSVEGRRLNHRHRAAGGPQPGSFTGCGRIASVDVAVRAALHTDADVYVVDTALHAGAPARVHTAPRHLSRQCGRPVAGTRAATHGCG